MSADPEEERRTMLASTAHLQEDLELSASDREAAPRPLPPASATRRLGRQPRPPPAGGRGHEGLAQPGRGTQAGRRPHRGGPGPGPRGPAPAQAGPRGRMESADTAQRRAALALAIIGALADGGLRRSEAAALTWGDVELWGDGTGRLTIQKSKNQPEPATVAVTETTARALREFSPAAPNTLSPRPRCSA